MDEIVVDLKHCTGLDVSASTRVHRLDVLDCLLGTILLADV